jgi:FkbM family methyltransferase
MINDPRDGEGSRLKKALLQLGRDPALRLSMLDLLRQAERQLQYLGPLREDVTGPIIDALHCEDDLCEKTLADGTRFAYLYRTKIARDFLMSEMEQPSHVWEPQTTRLLMELSSDLLGDVIVGGAYFGDQAILVARSLPKGGRVHCFEPNGDQVAMLAKNVELNRLDNVVVNQLGLWSQSNEKLRLDGFDSFANVISAEPDDAAAIDSISIDDYCAATGTKIGMIQLDIEGAEYKALLGARRTLEVDKPHVIFEVHRHYVDWSNGLDQTDICRYLAHLGYTIFAVRDFNSHYELRDKTIELIPVDKVYLEGPPHGFNMIAIQNKVRITDSKFRIVERVSPKLLLHKDPALHHPITGL